MKNSSLEYLDVSRNRLQTIPKGLSPNIRIIILPENQIAAISNDTFVDLDYLGESSHESWYES